MTEKSRRVHVTLLLVVTIWMTTPSVAVPPNNVCCDRANDKAACLVRTNSPTDFDNCLGGYGVDCEGIEVNLLGLLSFNLMPPKDNGNGTVTLMTSVGSILHDICCISNPKGSFCDTSNYPLLDLFNFFGHADNNCACLVEFRKGVSNLLSGHVWSETYQKADFTSDLGLVPSLLRYSWLPLDLGIRRAYIPYPSTWEITERKATSRFCAPSGTALDCPSEDDNCHLPSCFGSFHCKACAGTGSSCSNTQRARWNAGGRNHSQAGDSDYCCSGEFNEVRSNSVTGRRHGICA
jgi:hypothetical protein